MVSYFKDFLLNIFIIFSPLVFYPYLNKYKAQGRDTLYRVSLYILFAFALLLTMSFPVNLHGLIYDFRSIPLVLGSLYGGPIVTVFLFLTVVVYRFILDNPQQLAYMISVLPAAALVIMMQKRFQERKLYQKILLSIILCTCIKLIIFGIYLAYIHEFARMFNQPLATIETYLLQAVIIAVCVYLVEFLHTYSQMQEEMIKSEKTKIVSEMAAAVAHEIRNPLTTVRGFIQLFGADDLDKQKKEFYQKICLEELDRAQLIITDYLSLAKPDPEIIETIAINEEIQYLSNVLMTYANYNNIQISGILSEDPSLKIVGDRYKFRQALINIGKNAIEALPEGGLLEIMANGTGEEVFIVIRDNGIGMTPEQINRLGTPYYSTKEKGTGLGTMVSFGIIKKMSGRIGITSERGVGTEYTLSFPRVNG
ncbi:sensor histidine kinase [Brevibacillus choshinensis]|uniref:histidine kinase n=1 Tax=Brevibacillus choshinensis TaxID=54911 RepID=A0ABX7FWY9_BRECH|nr:HAMP domain-containing sensor histidine kinase [Brevibacillus choshinensis]QRG70240.1 HAMP domain-containing histidine kinase [Brevibacillus choshinensis]